MVKIRLARFGSKKRPVYRLVVSDIRSSRNGRFLERVGWYDPRAAKDGLKMDLVRVDYWISNGAQPSDKAAALIKDFRKSVPAA